MLLGTGDGGVANLETISFLRNGERFPSQLLKFSRFVVLQMKLHVVDSQVIKGFLSSIIPEKPCIRGQLLLLSIPTANFTVNQQYCYWI
jgi:sRNA-binding regulator protein Hfq